MPPHTPTEERVSQGQSWPSGVRCRRAGGQAAGSSLLTRCVSLQRAFNALCHSTHLYGRRLVLEWADSEVSLQALRRKTAEHFHGKRTAGGQAPSHPCPSMSSTPTLRIPSASPSQWGVLTSADGIGGLHTRGVSPSSPVIGRPGRKSGRGGAWIRVVILTTAPPPLPPPFLSGCCRLAVTATKGHSSRPVALSPQRVLCPEGKPGAPRPDFPAPDTPLLVPPQLPG